MCTTIAYRDNGLYFGRNMDLDSSFGERVIIAPRNFILHQSGGGSLHEHYAFIGMAAVEGGYPLMADGMNEHGLCAAALRFAQYAVYPDISGGISPYELVAAVLAECRNVEQAKQLISSRGLSSKPYSERLPLAPLHWHIADNSAAIVVESTSDGLKIHDDAVGVLTNSPPYEYHINNLKRSMNISPIYPKERIWGAARLRPTGNGFGGIGLAGDHTSESRYVRAAFHLQFSEGGGAGQCFHLLDTVAVSQGSVITEDNTYQLTRYSSCMAAGEGIYYYSTYSDRRINGVRLNEKNKQGSMLTEYPLSYQQDVYYHN